MISWYPVIREKISEPSVGYSRVDSDKKIRILEPDPDGEDPDNEISLNE